MVSAYGELILEMNNGIEYVIRFGDLHKGQKDDMSLYDGSRYLYVFARVSNSSQGSNNTSINTVRFAKELNKKLSEWFYVISKDDFEKIMLDRSSFVIPNPDFSTVNEVAASHILISYKGANRADSKIIRTKNEAKKEAERIRGLILNQDKDFAEMAKKYSEGPSGAKGGDLGSFKFEVMTKSFSQAAFALEIYEVSEVVETEFGFHIIKRTPIIGLEERKEEMEERSGIISDTPELTTVKIGTIPEKMNYNIAEFSVKAGKAIKLIFGNRDSMPHNIVLVNPNKADEVGQAAITLGAAGHDVGFVPQSKEIIWASKLIGHNGEDVIWFKAPTTLGDYQYVCTFPGHHFLMRGLMKVR